LVAFAIGLVLAVPSARPTFAATPSKDCDAPTKVDVEFTYQALYVDQTPGSSTFLQFEGDPAVERLFDKSEGHRFDAFVALHAPDYAATDLAGPLIALRARRLGPTAASGAVTISLGATPGRSLKMTVPLVCDSGSDDWIVPLDDFCRALRAVDADQQCSKAVLRKAKKGLPRSLAKAPTRAPTVVTTPTTIPLPTTTTYTVPPIPPTSPPVPDGYCPYVGRACDDPNIAVPDPDCTCGGSR
jgi:hypothetical protein